MHPVAEQARVQGCRDVYTLKPVVVGAPGPLHLTIRDGESACAGGGLTEDTLVLALAAGPPARLAVEEPQPIAAGLRAVLPQLRVIATDAHGNPTTDVSCEVVSCSPGRELLMK